MLMVVSHSQFEVGQHSLGPSAWKVNAFGSIDIFNILHSAEERCNLEAVRFLIMLHFNFFKCQH